MGKPIDVTEAGLPCGNCWGLGKTFGEATTPRRIYLTASGFAGACAVCNGTFILEQNIFQNCTYAMDDGTRFAEVIFGVANTQFTMEISGGPNCYIQVEGLCKKVSTLGPIRIEVS